MKIIAFVGMPASGKSEAGRVAVDQGIYVINMGDVIREEVVRRGLEPTDVNTGGVGTDLRENEGMDAVAKRCIPKINNSGTDMVVIDGVRGIAEVEMFKQEFGEDFTLVNIDSSIQMRLERVKARGRSDDMTDIEALRRRDERELGWGMGEAITASDITISNTTGLEEFRQKIVKLLEELHDKS
ncbi:MAG TPA: flagellar hook-basal body complex protein FliE [Methanosarcinaceae archaeon]|nr:flagellar hook-basal body complex protein FliE [Methanosarcinaceae archaeon]